MTHLKQQISTTLSIEQLAEALRSERPVWALSIEIPADAQLNKYACRVGMGGDQRDPHPTTITLVWEWITEV